MSQPLFLGGCVEKYAARLSVSLTTGKKYTPDYVGLLILNTHSDTGHVVYIGHTIDHFLPVPSIVEDHMLTNWPTDAVRKYYAARVSPYNFLVDDLL